MKKILWLPAWFPNKIEPLSGDFIQRHAKSVSLYHTIQVIFVIRDKDGKITRNTKEENSCNGNLAEKVIYYYTPVFPVSFIDKIISYRRYRMLYRRAVRDYIENQGLPYCVHVHIASKNGLIALWLKKKYGVSFVLSEQWTVYLSEARPNFLDFSWIFKFMWRKILKATSGTSVVSHYLGNSIKNIYKKFQYVVIPNVVDSSIFFPSDEIPGEVRQFIHISTLGYQKNPEAILKAFAIVKKHNVEFNLSVIGPENHELLSLSHSLGLRDNISFYNEVPQPELATFLRKAEALILYSRFETFGCVIIEANSCGLPTIVSDIPVFHEIIGEGVNGYFVPADDPEALAQKILWFINNYPSAPEKKNLQKVIEKYNYRNVGKLFSEFYDRSITSNPSV